MLNECNGCEYQCNLSHIDICTLGSPCPHQRSTPMTNEEWFCGLSTEEKAKWLSRHSQFMYECGQKQVAPKIMYEESWEWWLKQPHNGGRI